MVASVTDTGPEDGLAGELAALESLADASTAEVLPGDVLIGALRSLEGGLPEGAEASVRAARFRLRRCLANRDGPRSFVATLVVKEGGEVSKVSVVAKGADAGAAPALEACLASALETVRFASPDAGLARLSVVVDVR